MIWKLSRCCSFSTCYTYPSSEDAQANTAGGFLKNRCSEAQSGCSLMPKGNVIYSIFDLTLLFVLFVCFFSIKCQSYTSQLHRELLYQYNLLKDILHITLKSLCNWSQLFEIKCFSSNCTLISALLWFWCKYCICKSCIFI